MTDLMTYDDPRRPVTTLADLRTLDQAEVLEGYRDGHDDFPCSGNRSRSYWHGWQNGMVDHHHMELTPDQRALAKEAHQHMSKGLQLHESDDPKA